MRIALIAPLVSPIREPNLGGAQAVVSDLARELTRRGHDLTVYAARGSAIEDVAIAPVDVDPDALAGDVFQPDREPVASAAMVAAYRAVYDHAAAGRYEVIHNHGFDQPAISVAASRGVPVLHTLHLPPSPMLAAALNDARRSTPVWCAVVSQAQASRWRLLTPVDGVLRNGVPIDDIPFAGGRGTGAVIAARFSAEKGIDEGIVAARAAGTTAEVYGTPYDALYEQSVRDRWRDDTDVHFRAPVARDVLWYALGAAAVAVCLSQWEEPFGMVAAEAQAAGTPVVASARGGLPEVVHDGISGYLVDARDARAAAAAISVAQTLDRGDCRRHAQRSLSLAGAVTAHEELYARVARG